LEIFNRQCHRFSKRRRERKKVRQDAQLFNIPVVAFLCVGDTKSGDLRFWCGLSKLVFPLRWANIEWRALPYLDKRPNYGSDAFNNGSLHRLRCSTKVFIFWGI
jgi:hypothetical protein